MTAQRVALALDLTQEQEVALETALLRARAAERSEVVRLNRLGTTGYADRAGGAASQSTEAKAAALRVEALTAVLEALRAS